MGMFKLSGIIRSTLLNPIEAQAALEHFTNPKVLERQHHAVLKQVIEPEIEDDLLEANLPDDELPIKTDTKKHNKDKRWQKKKKRSLPDLEALINVQVSQFKSHYDNEFRKFFVGIHTKEAFKARTQDYQTLRDKFGYEKGLLIRAINQAQLWGIKKYIVDYDPGSNAYRDTAS